MNTSGRIYDDFVRLIFLYGHREASFLARELPEESEQFRFLRAARLENLKVSVGLILTKKPYASFFIEREEDTEGLMKVLSLSLSLSLSLLIPLHMCHHTTIRERRRHGGG